ncbi:MAG: hypothetical protein HFI09_03860 [Bacilli bacterium]|nr:hypothetical protein [Bacilli bacterium]
MDDILVRVIPIAVAIIAIAVIVIVFFAKAMYRIADVDKALIITGGKKPRIIDNLLLKLIKIDENK